MGVEPESRVMAAVMASPAAAPPPLKEGNVHNIPPILPHGRVFPIQIGDELFKLSGASICSDAPSYFSQYFKCQLEQAEAAGDDPWSSVKTLYIDRDPGTFRDISLHLQGYSIKPRDATHFVRLFADAHFYSLPKLISQIYEENIFMQIGGREFQIPRDVFNDPGNTPNFFSLGFAIFFSRPDDLFPGLPREGLLRPPSIIPPSVPNRDPDTFSDLLRMLRGYPFRIRDEEHRQDLLKDARYFHFKGLEQRIIAHEISFNLGRGKEEIVLRLENIQKSGVSVETGRETDDPLAGWVNYARPFVDDKPRELVLEIGGDATKVHFTNGVPRAEFFKDTKARIARLFEVIATKLSLPHTTQPLGLLMASGGAAAQPASPGNTPLSADRVRVIFDADSSVNLNGRSWAGVPAARTNDADSSHTSDASETNPRKRRRTVGGDDGAMFASGTGDTEEWMVRRGQWRLRIRSTSGGKAAVECVLVAVKLEAMSSELARNSARGFLTS